MTAYWEHFEHRADIGVRGIGNTLSQAFAQTALAMSAVITDLELIAPNQAVEIHCQAPDIELLLVDWLNALIFEMSTRRMLFSRFDIDINDHQLTATAWGERVEPQRHQPAVEVKGGTYTELSVTQSANGTWLAQCVLDV